MFFAPIHFCSCTTSRECIREIQRCDDVEDCEDGSDEENCINCE